MKTIAFIFLYIITNLCYSVNSQETTSQKQCAAIGEYVNAIFLIINLACSEYVLSRLYIANINRILFPLF